LQIVVCLWWTNLLWTTKRIFSENWLRIIKNGRMDCYKSGSRAIVNSFVLLHGEKNCIAPTWYYFINKRMGDSHVIQYWSATKNCATPTFITIHSSIQQHRTKMDVISSRDRLWLFRRWVNSWRIRAGVLTLQRFTDHLNNERRSLGSNRYCIFYIRNGQYTKLSTAHWPVIFRLHRFVTARYFRRIYKSSSFL
jgi:hypothetical protein